MCTVSFVPAADRVVITSNRDEQVLRPALAPQVYEVNGQKLTFPKDPLAGGTWYAARENGDVLVLLNGAAEKHAHRPPYRRSRGLIVLDLLSSEVARGAWDSIDLEQVEPFTVVLFENGKLYQLRWDGQQKENLTLDPQQSHIWSSSTLYPKEVREQRSGWFREFLQENTTPGPEQLLDFHRYSHKGDHQNGLVIDRNGALKTLSITQTVIDGDGISMAYVDLANPEKSLPSTSLSLIDAS